MKKQLLWMFGLASTVGLSVFAQQASLTLSCNGGLCYANNTDWTLTKEKVAGQADPLTPPGTATFTVTATRGTTSNNLIKAVGYVVVKNAGAAPATIGNIVVNLQKPRTGGGNPPWVSAAANCANATGGDAATVCNIQSSGTQESATLNASQAGPVGGPAVQNYSTYGPGGVAGRFTETPGSGTINFTDASNNSVFSMVPQPVIPGGQSVTLLYEATFDNTVLKLPVAGALRVEVLVSFGNAGTRGGGDASASNIDVNGNGTIDADEANVRTVVCRTTAALPALEKSNDSVTLTDTAADISTTGTVTYNNFFTTIGASGSGTEVINSTVNRTVRVDVTGGEGRLINTAHLDGASSSVTVNGPIDPLTGLPTTQYTFTCCVGVDLDATANVTVVSKPDDEVKDGDFCSFSQGGFGGPGAPYQRLAANFASIYGLTGVEVGIPGASGFSMIFTSAAAVQAYLPAGGGANKLTADLVNPTSTPSGQFGGQTLALKLNIALSTAGANPAGFGGLYYCAADNPTSSLKGMTVAQILAAAETAIGGGARPTGYSYSSLAGLVANLDLSFDSTNSTNNTCGVASAWAIANLKKSACQ